MTKEQIENFLAKKTDSDKVQISFKSRNNVTGIFVHANDYDHLKSKNLWRIVREHNIEEYASTNDINYARIFNGSEFTRLQ